MMGLLRLRYAFFVRLHKRSLRTSSFASVCAGNATSGKR